VAWNCIQETLIPNRVDLDRLTLVEQLLVYMHIHSIGAWTRDREQCPEVIRRKMQVDALLRITSVVAPQRGIYTELTFIRVVVVYVHPVAAVLILTDLINHHQRRTCAEVGHGPSEFMPLCVQCGSDFSYLHWPQSVVCANTQQKAVDEAVVLKPVA
jgi:hypothetical protein